jgi:type I restriction enzyme S subunit
MEKVNEQGTYITDLRIDYDEAQSGLTIFEQGDVLFAKITPCMENGKGAYIEELPTKLAFGSTEFHVLRPRSNILGKFLFYATYNPIYRAFAAENMTGAAGQKRVTSRFIKDSRLFLPPLDEQRRITAFLDKSCEIIDAVVRKKLDQIDLLHTLSKSIIQEIFTRKTWKTKRIKDITLKIGSGITPDGGASGYLDYGIPLIRSQNVHFDGLHLDDVAYISKDTHAAMSNSRIKPRDILLNITGASIGRCTYVPDEFGEGNVNQHVCIIRVNQHTNHRYLCNFLASPFGQSQIFSSFTGASRQGLGQKDLGNFVIPLPPINDQSQIVEEVELRTSKVNVILGIIDRQISFLQKYRASLIHECVTGQRRVTEAEIERVRAQLR